VTIRVLLADDHPVVREGLRGFLELQEGVEVVAEAADGAAAVEQARAQRPDVALVDLVMPVLDGLGAIAGIREASPATRVVVLTSFAEDERVVAALHAGAAGYLLKDAHPKELVQAIRAAHAGQAPLAPAVTAAVVAEARHAPPPPSASAALTERELEVLRLLARGLSNKLIARELVVSEKTVKTHVSSILAKLGVRDRTQAALLAVREGIAEPAGG
jgi:DNA-binding NarL/FixJ family response regulator